MTVDGHRVEFGFAANLAANNFPNFQYKTANVKFKN